MSRSAYGRSECWICGKVISVAGFAQFNHKMMHVRRGEMSKYERAYYGSPYRNPLFEITEKGQQTRIERLKQEE